jgi:hypothetical protein
LQVSGRFERWLPLAGVVLAVLLAIALLTENEPSNAASVEEVFSHWSAHGGGKMWLAILGLELAAVLLVSFGVALRTAIRSREDSAAVYSSLVLGGAILAAVGITATSMLVAAAANAASENADEPGVRTVVFALEQLRSWDWLMWTPGLTVMLVAAGLGGLRTGALPRALGWSAIVLGVAYFTPLGSFAFVALPLWTAAAGAVLYRKQRLGGLRSRASRDGSERKGEIDDVLHSRGG